MAKKVSEFELGLRQQVWSKGREFAKTKEAAFMESLAKDLNYNGDKLLGLARQARRIASYIYPQGRKQEQFEDPAVVAYVANEFRGKVV